MTLINTFVIIIFINRRLKIQNLNDYSNEFYINKKSLHKMKAFKYYVLKMD